MLPAMREVEAPGTLRTLARLLVLTFVVLPVGLTFTPWQQSVRGTGRVSAVSPLERQQTIDTPVEGRVMHWHVAEGSRVKKGDPIADISDLDPSILERLAQERDAVLKRVDAAKSREFALGERIAGQEGSRRNALAANEARIQTAQDRIRGAEQSMAAAEASLTAARLNLERQQKLLEKGLTSTRNLELAQMEMRRGEAEVDRAKAVLDAERNTKGAAEAEQGKIESDFKAVIEDGKASRLAAQAEIANANAELQRMEVRLARQKSQTVRAPREGTIFRLLAQPGSDVLKGGDPLAILVPDTQNQVVEILIDGNDGQ